MLAEEPTEDYVKQNGWILLFRSLKGHWLWDESRVKSKLEAWLYLLFEAQYTPTKKTVGYDLIPVSRGQVLTSQEKLSREWGWNRGRVRLFLDLLENDEMISQHTTAKYTMITICKYDSYQSLLPTKDQQTSTKPTANGLHSDTTNKGNESKRRKIVFTPPTLNEVIEYFTAKGFSKELAQKAFEHYANGNPAWTDTTGQPVRSWKQKMGTVWMKEENKIEPEKPKKYIITDEDRTW